MSLSRGFGVLGLVALGRVAVLADGAGMPVRVDSRHRDGVNVTAGDGSVSWVRRSMFNELLNHCTKLSPECNPLQDRIWQILRSR